MLFDEPSLPLIDDTFDAAVQGKSPMVARRCVRVRERLLMFLEAADMTPMLGAERTRRLEAERQVYLHGAFWSVFGPAEFIECLPLFVSDPWRMKSMGDAMTQLSMTSRLVDVAAAACGESVDHEQVLRVRRILAKVRMRVQIQGRAPVLRSATFARRPVQGSEPKW